LPGLALLLLRVTIGVIVVTQVTLQLLHEVDPKPGSLILPLFLGVSGTFLLVGFLTPVAGVFVSIYGLGVAISWISVPAVNVFDSKMGSAEIIAMSVAVALIGPGAYSLDARLFGRREIVIPPVSRNPES